MSLYNRFKTSEESEVGGVFIDYGINSKGEPTLIRVARAGGRNKRYFAEKAERSRPYKAAFDNGTITDDLYNKVLAEVYASAVIVGWEGVEDEEGNPMSFSFENAVKLLTDLPDLLTELVVKCSSIDMFRESVRKSISKN